MAKKILSEREYRKNILEIADMLGCRGDVIQIFNKYDTLLRNCTNLIERQAISTAGIQELHFFLNSKPGFMLVNGKLIGKE